MSKEYIEDRDGNFYVAGTRISLDSIIHAFRRGESPETICQNFELLDLEQLYGAIAHYLAHKAKLMRISCVRIRSGLKAKESPKRFHSPLRQPSGRIGLCGCHCNVFPLGLVTPDSAAL